MSNLVDEIKNGGKKQDPLAAYIKGISANNSGSYGPSYGSDLVSSQGYDAFMKMFDTPANLSTPEKLSVGAVNLGKGLTDPFVRQGKRLFGGTPASGADQKKLIEAQTTVADLKKKGKLSKRVEDALNSYKNSGGYYSQALKYIAYNQNNEPATYDYLTKTLKEGANKNKSQNLSDAAQIAMTVASPSNAVEGFAGKAVAPAILGGIIEGGLYGAATTAVDPNATLEDYLKSITQNAALGGAVPAAGGVVGKAVHAPAKFAETAVGTKTVDALAPYVSKADQVGRAVIDKTKGAITAIPGVQGALDRTAGIREKFKSQLIDSNAPIYDRIRKLEKSGDIPTGTADALYLKSSHIQGNKLANDFIDNNPALRTYHESAAALDGKSKKAIKAADDYAAARRDLELASKDKKAFSKKQLAAKQETLTQLEAKYGKDKLDASYKSLVAANREVTALLKGTGLSEEDFQRLIENDPNYIRTQRVQRESKIKEARQGKGGAGATSPIQKLDRNATQEQLSPAAALHTRIQQVHQWLANDELKRSLAKPLVKAGVGTAERTTENVTKRQAAQQFLADTREGKKIAARMTQKYSRELRVVQAELDKFNKKGLDIRLKDAGSKTDAPILSGVRDKLRGAKTVEGKTTQPLLKSHAVTGTVETKQFSRSMTANETRAMVENIISQPPKELAKIRRMIASRDPKAASLLADLTEASHNLEAHNVSRKAAYNEILNAKDGVYKGKLIMSYYDKGVKNVVSFGEKDAAIVHVLKGLDKQQMNAVLNTTRIMNNLFKYGTTQGNPAFAIPNYLRDQWFSSHTSESTWRTHNPIVATQGLMYGIMDGLGINVKNDAWQATKAAIEGSKRIDINRNLKAAVMDIGGQVKETRALSGKVKDFQLGHDTKWAFGKINGLISGLETATRFQNYKGTKALYLAKGATKDLAEGRAALAALRNSVDFGVSGDLGKVLNTIIPYFNASIQGPRTLLRAFSERPTTTSAKFITMAAPIMYAVNYNLADPQRAAAYADTPEYVRQGNLVFISGDKRFLIPIPKDLAGLYSPIRKSLEARAGLDGPTAFSDAKDLIGALTPIQTNSPLSAVASVLPGPIKAGLEIGSNKNFFTGGQIIPDSVKSKNDVPSEQYYRDANGKPKNVSGTAMKISKLFNISPLQLEHFQKQSFGELNGPIANNAVDRLSGNDTVGGRSVQDSIKRRFVYSGASANVGKFYDAYTPAQNARTAASSQITQLIKDGKRNEAARRAEEYNNSIEKRFADYKRLYGTNGTGDLKDIQDRIDDLKIAVTEKSFNARAKAK